MASGQDANGTGGEQDAEAPPDSVPALAAAAAANGAASAGGKLDDAAAAPTPEYSELSKRESLTMGLDREKVVLRVQVATKFQARFLTWSVIALNVAFVLFAAAMFATSQNYTTLGDLRDLYAAQLILAGVCLGCLLFQCLWTVSSMHAVNREGREWTSRQRYFFNTAALVLVISSLYCANTVATLSATLAEPNCGYPWLALAILEFFRRLMFSFMLLFLLARLHNMKRWRGDKALDAHPDRVLLVDRPWADKAKAHWIILGIFAFLVVFNILNLLGRLKIYDNGGYRGYAGGCGMVTEDIQCKISTFSKMGCILAFIVVAIFIGIWVYFAKQALKDHQGLPHSRYKDTYIFIRVQMRVVGPVQIAILLTVLLQELVPTLSGSCIGQVQVQMDNVALLLSLTVVALALSILYTPTNRRLDSPLQQEFLQEFAWASSDIEANMKRRRQRLTASEEAAAEQSDTVGDMLGLMNRGVAGVMGVVTLGATAGGTHETALERLVKEPMFCMETAVRLFYWTRLSYRNEPEFDYKHINKEHALALYNLTHFEKISHAATDTHCVLGWNNEEQQMVISFRGTASLENAITDAKAWRVRHQPSRKHKGFKVTCHAGFYAAWRDGDFNLRVMQRLREIDDAIDGPMRFWVTGHSLGGALAVLACSDIKREHPDSTITCYTYGMPRVFNKAGANEYNAQVPDTWAIINGRDPIPWIPKVGFKRVGKRASVDTEGNLLLRPSYFEMTVVRRGVDPKDHTTGAYALSIASIIKAQFDPARSLPGGEKGAQRLAAAVDLTTNLVVARMDLAGLRDREAPLELQERLDAKAAEEKAAAEAAAAGKPLPRPLQVATQECGGCFSGGGGKKGRKKGGKGGGVDAPEGGFDAQRQGSGEASMP